MTDRNLDDLHPQLKPLCEQWLEICRTQVISPVVYFTWRSPEEQDALYALGRTQPGKIVTNARAGQSKHNFTIDGKPASKAFDFFIKRDNGEANWDWRSTEFKTAVAIGKQLGLHYGGDWPGCLGDYDHFETD